MSSETLEEKRACILAPMTVILLPGHLTAMTHGALSGQFKNPVVRTVSKVWKCRQVGLSLKSTVMNDTALKLNEHHLGRHTTLSLGSPSAPFLFPGPKCASEKDLPRAKCTLCAGLCLLAGLSLGTHRIMPEVEWLGFRAVGDAVPWFLPALHPPMYPTPSPSIQLFAHLSISY